MNHQHNLCAQLQPSAGGVLNVWLDSPGRSVNVFDADMLTALEAVVEHAGQAAYRAIVFRSRKPGCFFAGADVKAIAALGDPEEVRSIVRRGQQLMRRVSELKPVTVAAIDGLCMGGGLEFAMACDVRIVSDSPKTKVGLPEIRLGLIPGWGGTQRLPGLVGLRQALAMILKGSSVSGFKARKLGLADFLAKTADFEQELGELLAGLLSGTRRASRPRRRVSEWLLDHTWLGRYLVLRGARLKIATQSVHYPALQEAIEAVSLAYDPQSDGYAFEQAAFSELLFTPTAQNLLGLFVERDRAKKPATWLAGGAAEATVLATGSIAVIGAGAMGAGIGALAASKGLRVVFKEIDQAAAHAGAERVGNILSGQHERHQISDVELSDTLSRTTFTDNWEDVSNCDLAIEAVLEVDAIKRDVFEMLDRYLPAQASIVSNTSSLSVTRMATATNRKSQVAGLHFFNPVHRMELVEVVRTEMTDQATVARLLDLVRLLGKTPIVTSDKPGFLVNRVLFPYLGEAIRMVAEGWDVAEIDRELTNFGMPMGPLELLDHVGIDIACHVAGSLSSIQSDVAIPTEFLANMTHKNWLGKKSQIGFYRWTKRQAPNPALSPLARPDLRGGDFERDGLTNIQRRLVYPMLNEAVHCLDELVVSEPWMVDLGMVLGTGFAPMRGGPLRMLDALGTKVVHHNMQTLKRLFGKRFAPADGLVSRARRGQKFVSEGFVADPLAWEGSHESRCSTES